MGEQLSEAPDRHRNEWVVLALLAEAPAHGFALARELSAEADLGRILTVRRPLVYRALDRLVADDAAEAGHREPGRAGPTRTVHRVTGSGRHQLDRWLATPAAHVRDLRVDFLVKLRLLERAGRDPAPLVVAQRAALAETFERLTDRTDATVGDVVDRWRAHNAAAMRTFLDQIVA